ncbi:CinA family protein, partial [bacterium]|nr:CinA family protein [bacterium]
MIQRIAKQCLFVCFIVVFSLPAFSEANDAPTKYAIVVTGGELLRGVYADGHTQFITSTLEPLGAKCVSAVCVGDTADDLQDALAFSFQHANLVLVTGGLGPTDDDVTRMTLSAFSGIELAENPEVVNEMLRRYGASSKDSLRANMRRQAMTPTKGRYMPNPNGSAVGLIFDDGNRVIASMPGPPRELQPMVKEQLLPFLAERFGIKTIGTSLKMRFINIGESQIDETMHKYLTLPKELMVSSLFEMGRVDLTLSLPGDSEQDRQTLKQLETELLAHIGDSMYSDKGATLEECVVALLKQNNVSLVTAEVGSGGAVSASLSRPDDAASVYSGGYVAPSDDVMALMVGVDHLNKDSHEALSKQIAGEIQKRAGSKWGLYISEIHHDEKS